MRLALFSILVGAILLRASATSGPLSRPYGSDEGTVQGTVVNLRDERVTETNILIEREGFSRRLLVDGAGEFHVNLPRGTYRLTARAAGFHDFHTTVSVAPRKTQSRYIKLKVIRTRHGCPPGELCL